MEDCTLLVTILLSQLNIRGHWYQQIGIWLCCESTIVLQYLQYPCEVCSASCQYWFKRRTNICEDLPYYQTHWIVSYSYLTNFFNSLDIMYYILTMAIGHNNSGQQSLYWNRINTWNVFNLLLCYHHPFVLLDDVWFCDGRRIWAAALPTTLLQAPADCCVASAAVPVKIRAAAAMNRRRISRERSISRRIAESIV